MPQANSGILTESDLVAFFQERVSAAATHQRTPVSPPTVYYLSGLLADHSHREEQPQPETLVEMQTAALEAPPTRALGLWRRMGDHSLMITGFFHENLEHRRISRSYYTGMGAAAYNRLSHMLPDPGHIFAELAQCFEHCANLLTEVREEAKDCTDTDIVKLYEQYCITGSPKIAERLRRLGVVPIRTRLTD